MAKPIDLTGRTFGRLTALEHVGTHRKGRVWRCSCECGAYHDAVSGRLLNGWTRSCGCLSSDHGRSLGFASATHGLSHKSSEYNIWSGMKARCLNPKTASFKRYGGRGISISQRWVDSFQNFLTDMGERPGPEYSLDRIDANGDYCPENCRWATQRDQQNNRTNNNIVTALGRSMSTARWEEVTGIRALTIRNRISAGWEPDEAVSRPPRICKRG